LKVEKIKHGSKTLSACGGICGVDDKSSLDVSDIEMKLGMIVYNNELQLKFEFCCC
jgi:hypothetical protein